MNIKKNRVLSSRLEIYKEDIKFSIAHFTIFNESERENIHGHNFEVSFSVEFKSKKNGMFRNYREIKAKLRSICSQVDEYLIIPERNKYIKIKKTKSKITVLFGKDQLVFLPRDIKILPIENTTVEDFSEWILHQMLEDENLISPKDVSYIQIEVSSYKGQSGLSRMTFPS